MIGRSDGTVIENPNQHVTECRRGVASALCRAAVEGARQLSIRRLRLFTPDQQPLYRRLGWKRLEDGEWKGHPVEIMTMELST